MLRAVSSISILFAFLFFSPVAGLSQQSTGSVRGHLDLPGGAPRMAVELIELTSGVRMLTATTDTASLFQFYDVPFGSYRVFGRQGLDTTAAGIVHVNSVVPVTIVLSRDTLMHAIDPASYPALTHTFYPRAMIEKMPALGEARRVENIFYNTPGVVPGENGRMHIRGEDANILTTIDGFPIANDLTRVYTPLLNANLIKSADVLRGGLNAEYGVATSGVLALTSQSGIGKQFSGGAYQTLGTFGLSEQGAVLGGGVSEDVGYFAAYNRYSTKRYLEPTSGLENNHTDGSVSTIFGKLDLRLSNDFDLVVLGTYNDGVHSIPNALIEEDSAQDQRVDLLDYMFGTRVNWKVNDYSVLSAFGYTRANTTTRLSSGSRNIEDSADNANALRTNEQFFVGSDRDDQAHGGLLEYSARLKWGDNNHEIKIGVGGETIPLKQSLTLAVTDPTLSRDTLGGDSRWAAHDLNLGGDPLVLNESQDAMRINAFIQDEVQLSDAFTLGIGVRYDMFKLHEKESAISPRVHAVYKASRDVSFRASYNRLVSQPPLENILIATTQALQHLYTTPTLSATPIRSEKTNAIELGALWSAGRFLDLDLAVYTKLIEDMIVSTELGSTGIMLPINLVEGRVMGGEFLARIKPWNSLSGQVSVGFAKAEGIRNGSEPVISGGPAIGYEAHYYNSQTESFRLLTDQTVTASWLLNYDNGGGYHFTLGGRFDSGLPFDFENQAKLNDTEARGELTRRSFTAETQDLLRFGAEPAVAPRFTLDLGLGLDLRRFLGLPVKISAAAINVLDAKYLTRFSPGYGGAHHGQPRSFVLKLEASS